MTDNPVSLRKTLLKNNDWEERRRAARLLGRDKSQETIKTLLKSFDDEIDDDVIHASILSLARLEVPEVINLVSKPRIFSSDNPSLRWAAAYTFGKLGNANHFDYLSRLIDDPDWAVRNEAVIALERLITQVAKTPSMDNLKILIRMLHIEHISLHNTLVETISKFGSSAIGPLVETLSIQNDLIKTGAVKILGNIGSNLIFEDLILLAADESVEVRKEVIRALGKISSCTQSTDRFHAYNTIIERLRDGNREVVETAIRTLVSRKDDEILISILIDALKNIFNVAIRKNILTVMGKIKHPDMKLPILNHLGNTYYFIRRSAAKAILEYGEEIRPFINEILMINKTPIEPLIAEATQTEHIRRRVRAIKSLGQLKNPLAFDVLSKLEQEELDVVTAAAEDALYFIRDAIRARIYGAYVFGELGGEESIHILIDELSDKSAEVRWAVVQALRKIRSDKVLDELAHIAVNDEASYVRREAIAAIGDIGVFDEKIKNVLLKTLKDEIRSVRAESARVLGRILDDDVVDALIQTFYDQFSSVRTNALNALFNIGKKVLPKIRAELKRTDKKNVRLNAMILLGVLQDYESLPYLLKIANKEKDKDAKRYVKSVIKLLEKKVDEKSVFEELLS